MANEDNIFSDEPPSLFSENYEPVTVDAPEYSVEEDDVPEEMVGLCGKCLDTGFVHGFRDGVMGVLFNETGQDSSGNPKKRLVVCGHNLKVGY